MNIEKRIKELEEKAGIKKDIPIIFIRRSIIGDDGKEINGKPECPGWEDTSRCRRYQEFCKSPQIKNGLAVYIGDCDGCNGNYQGV